MNPSSLKLRVWLVELRAPFFTAAVVPTLLGTALAWHALGEFDALLFLLTLVGVVMAHAGTNVVNDYFDYKSGTDVMNRNRSPFNGGSPFLLDGTLTPTQVYRGAMAMFAIAAIIGLYLAYSVTWVIIPLGVIGIGLGYFYTSPRVNLAGMGVGELAVGMGFGPLIVEGAYIVQTGVLSLEAFLAGLPVGLLIGLVLFINQFPDMEADKNAGKVHWVARMGLKSASAWYVGLMVATFVTIALLWSMEIYPVYVLVALAPAALAFKASRIVREKYNQFKELLPAQAMTVQIHLLVGLLLSVGFIVAGML